MAYEITRWPRQLRAELSALHAHGIEHALAPEEETPHVVEKVACTSDEQFRDLLRTADAHQTVLLTHGVDADGTIHEAERIHLIGLTDFVTNTTPQWLRDAEHELHAPALQREVAVAEVDAEDVADDVADDLAGVSNEIADAVTDDVAKVAEDVADDVAGFFNEIADAVADDVAKVAGDVADDVADDVAGVSNEIAEDDAEVAEGADAEGVQNNHPDDVEDADVGLVTSNESTVLSNITAQMATADAVAEGAKVTYTVNGAATVAATVAAAATIPTTRLVSASRIITLVGALPPALLQTLAQQRTTLPCTDNSRVVAFQRQTTVHVSNHRVDLSSYRDHTYACISERTRLATRTYGVVTRAHRTAWRNRERR